MKSESYSQNDLNGTIQDKLPKVSVIVPVYNMDKYLSACVHSIISQSLEDIEIILVDDGSTDRSPSLCDELSINDKRIRVIHKENEGLGFARNSALRVARGEFVTFVDSDDYIAKNTLEFAYGLAVAHDADEVRYLFRRVSGESSRHEFYTNSSGFENMTEAFSLDEKLNPILRNIGPLIVPSRNCVFSTGSVCTAIYRRSVIEENGLSFFSEREYVSEDYIFNLEFALKCRKIIFTNAALYFYRANANSLSKRCDENKVLQSVAFANKVGELLDSVGYQDAHVFAMGYVIGLLRTYYRAIFYSGKPIGKQKELFKNIHEIDCIRTIKRLYPAEFLPVFQRLVYELGFKNMFYPCRTLFLIRDKNLFRMISRMLFRS
ncbi:MAG: glycosyltransferase [Duncaniella sp.]|nr:glycosyltransferase [Duncaniella sp.]